MAKLTKNLNIHKLMRLKRYQAIIIIYLFLIFQIDQGNYQDFKEFIEANFIYVDKTDLIYKIVQLKAAFIINSERRTGKTLLLSTIKAMFEETAEWWHKFGKDLKVMSIDPRFFDRNPYPVIEFTFPNCNSNQRFISCIAEGLDEAIAQYQLPLRKTYEEIETNQPLSLNKFVLKKFNQVILELSFKFKKPAIITVDESDQPLINQMFNDDLNIDEKALKMKETIDSFNEFYGFIKGKIPKQVRMIVVAGHSMIARTTLYSGILS